MEKQIIRLNPSGLMQFNKTLELSNQLQAENEFRPAEWFDTPEKRMQWWLDLEPQWRQAFNEAVLFRGKGTKAAKTYMPEDQEIVFIFEQDVLCFCGNGPFKYRNNRADISFQLTNLTGVKNLTNLERLEVDYNGLIASLEPLSKLFRLHTLWCDNNQITDLTPLMTLYSLSDLCCWNNQITQLEPLASLTTLRHLTLSLHGQGNPVTDLDLFKKYAPQVWVQDY